LVLLVKGRHRFKQIQLIQLIEPIKRIHYLKPLVPILSFHKAKCIRCPSKFNIIIAACKRLDLVRGQGGIRFESGAYTSVREHFETDRNAAIGQEMGF
jgi:hypothetical protein